MNIFKRFKKQESAANQPETAQFSSKEIKRISKRFSEYDYLTISQIESMPEFSLNRMFARVAKLMDKQCDEQISFSIFVHVLWIFSEKASTNVKLEYAFKVFDADNDGVINASDLYQVLCITIGDQYDSQLFHQLVCDFMKRTVAKSDDPNREHLTFEELTQILSKEEIVENLMTIPFPY